MRLGNDDKVKKKKNLPSCYKEESWFIGERSNTPLSSAHLRRIKLLIQGQFSGHIPPAKVCNI